jgi:cyclophilin family peptidyl-prolyl cis-trans isomerase
MKNFKTLLFVALSLIIIFGACKKDEDPPADPCPETPVVDLGDDATLVYGNTLTLDAGNSGATYLWSTGETTQTIEVDTAGIYSVEVSQCDKTDADEIEISMVYPTIKIETDFGDFRIWLYHQTPIHRANFIELANDAFYDSLTIHRVVYDFVIQGGDPEGTGYGGPGYTMPAEIIPGLDHVYGAVGMARLSDDINPDRDSNGSQFYVVSDPDGEPFLNDKYSVFGIVFTGMDVVFAISEVDVDGNSYPVETVYMTKVSVENYSASQLQNNFGFTIP